MNNNAFVPSQKEILQQLECVRVNAIDNDSRVGNYLLRKKLIRHNYRTGWLDLTPCGRAVLAKAEGKA